MPVDAQVAAVETIGEPNSLLDVVLHTYKGQRHQNGDLFLVRVVYCGKSREGSVHPKLQELAVESCAKANAANPFFERENDSNLSGLLLDYGDKFVHLIEGYERHVFAYLAELCQSECGRGKAVEDARLLFVDDDLDSRLLHGWVYVSKVPVIPSNLSGGMTEDELVTAVSRDVESIVELGRLAAESGDKAGASFSVSARINHMQLFPKPDTIDQYFRSDAPILAVSEFVENTCGFPNLVREIEVNYPAEDPLKY